MQQKSDLFLVQCKENYFNRIFPADSNAKETKGFHILKEIAQSYFAKNQYKEFEDFFMEGQYLIQLWAAHLILEYGTPNEMLKQKCLAQIKKYSESTLLPEIATQEKGWLKIYLNKE